MNVVQSSRKVVPPCRLIQPCKKKNGASATVLRLDFWHVTLVLFFRSKNATRAFLSSFGADRQSEMHGMSAWEKAWCACFGFCVSKRHGKRRSLASDESNWQTILLQRLDSMWKMPSTLHTRFGFIGSLCISLRFFLLRPPSHAPGTRINAVSTDGGVAGQEDRFADHVPIPVTEAVHRTYRSTKSTHRKATK